MRFFAGATLSSCGEELAQPDTVLLSIRNLTLLFFLMHARDTLA